MAHADQKSDFNVAKRRKQGKAPITLNLLLTKKSFEHCKRTTPLTEAEKSQLSRWKDAFIFAVQKLRFLELSQVDRERAVVVYSQRF